MERQDKKKMHMSLGMLLKVALSSCIYLLFIISIVTLIYGKNNPDTLLNISVIIIATVYTFFDIYLKIKSKTNNIDEISEGLKNTFNNSLRKLEVPIMFIEKNGKVIWENGMSAELELSEYNVELTYALSKNNAKHPEITVVNQVFAVYHSELELEGTIGTLVMLVDKTQEKELERVIDNTKTVIGCVTIDSYEDAMQGLEDIDKYNTMAQIDKELIAWISKFNGVVNKIEKDKYVYIMERQYVKELENNAFEILKKINEVSEGIVKVPITISIGLSMDEETLYGRYKSAVTALDVAQGRGGNQAVIKNNKKYEIYGESVEHDKTNRVRARTIATALKEIIQKSEHVYIMGHKNTDIDCIGAAVGIYKIAREYGKKAHVVVDIKNNASANVAIDRLSETAEYKDVFVTKDEIKKPENENSLIVIVDTHKQSYLAYPDFLDEFDKVVIIDHHRRGPEFIQNAILTYHEVYASSTSELVAEILMYVDDVKLTSKEAETIYSGIVIDTKNFTFKTGVRTFQVAAYLKKMGMDMSEIKHMFQNDFATYMARVNVVKNAEIIDNQIAISCVEKQQENMSVIASQAADELLGITGILASFVLCEIDGIISISGRSLGDINVQLILEKLGGGGHLTFAGAQLAGVTMAEAKQKLLEEIKEYFQQTK